MDDQNPYAAPTARVEPPAEAAAESSRPLFKLGGIGLATFIGSPIAGGILIGLNERAIDRPGRFWPAVGMAVAATAGFMLLAFLLPEQVPAVVFTIAQVFAMTAIARHWQGKPIDARIAAGLPMRSNWAAFGIGLLVLLGLLLLIAAAVFATLQATGGSFDELMREIAALAPARVRPFA